MKLKRLTGFLTAVLLIISSVLLSACGKSKYSVTFDYNYIDAPAAVVREVESGAAVQKPDDPVRDEYEFKGWFKESACSEDSKFDFSSKITSDFTLYAGWEALSGFVVTFDYNYSGAQTTSLRVAEGQSVTRTEDPKRDGYFFGGWYTDEECEGEPYDFSAPVTASLTLYAKWTEDTGDNSVATFYWNYQGNTEVYTTVIFNTGEWITKPVDPAREGYVFDGWFADAEGAESFNFNSRYSENTAVYAAWRKIYTFEAEYTDLDGKPGQGYSGNTSGLGLISGKDAENAGASNGYYVTSLYYDGATLEFEIESEEATSDVTIAFRFSAEYDDMIFEGDELYVEVNGTTRYNCEVSLTGAYSVTEGGENYKRPFSNHIVATKVSLVAGKNTIVLTVNNSEQLSGATMNAKAPMVDCMYLYTNAVLSWEPKTSNVS